MPLPESYRVDLSVVKVVVGGILRRVVVQGLYLGVILLGCLCLGYVVHVATLLDSFVV